VYGTYCENCPICPIISLGCRYKMLDVLLGGDFIKASTIAMPEISQIPNAERQDSCHELEASTPEMGDRILVAYERTNHTFSFESCVLPGTANEKMAGLNNWRIAKLGAWQLITAYMLCKRPYIAIGTFGVGGSRTASPLT
jgi:hypothetical protein